MISRFTFSATGSGASLTYAEVGTIPATANAARRDTDANVAGGSVQSVAGPVTVPTGKSAKTTSSVRTANGRSLLSVVIDVVGQGMKATGFAQHGLQYISHSPASFTLDIEEIEFDGDYSTLDFRLEQPQDGDHLRELSDEVAPASIEDKCKFERVDAHLTLFRLQIKLLLQGDKHRLQVHSTHEREGVTVKPKLSSRDFEFDPKTRTARFVGHLDEEGRRVRSIEISIDPGRTSDENNLILSLLGTQSSKSARQTSTPDQTVAT